MWRVCCFACENTDNYFDFYYEPLNKKIFKGELSVFEINNEEILLPKNTKILPIPIMNIDRFLKLNIKKLLYLVSYSNNNKYFIISEKIFIRFKHVIVENFDPPFIYKYGNYIIKNNFGLINYNIVSIIISKYLVKIYEVYRTAITIYTIDITAIFEIKFIIVKELYIN